MNSRRSFFKSLATIVGVGAVAPNIFIPKFESVRWKSITNQLWVPADYYGTWVFVGPRVIDMPFGGMFPPNTGDTVRQPMVFTGFGDPNMKFSDTFTPENSMYIHISSYKD